MRQNKAMVAIAAFAAIGVLSACGARVSDAEVQAAQGAAPAATVAVPDASAPQDPAAPLTGQDAPAVPASVRSTPTDAAVPSAPVAGDPQKGKPGKATPVVAPGGSAAAPKCTAKLSPIVLGQVGTFSGLVGASLGSGKTGLAVWAADVNARGGIACHPVVLYSMDDASDPSKSAAAVETLVKDKKVVAFVASFPGIVINAYRSTLDKFDIPTIGGDLLSGEWSEDPNLYAVGGVNRVTYYAAIKNAADQNRKKVGLLYCVESVTCTDGKTATIAAARDTGSTIAYQASVSLTQTDYLPQCQSAKNASVDVLLSLLDSASLERLGRSCSSIGYFPLIAASALAAIPAIADNPDLNKAGVLASPAVFPWMQSDSPAQAAFQKAYKTFAPTAAPAGSAAIAWASGMMLEKAMGNLGEKATATVTSEMVFQGLGTIKNETLDKLIPPTTYTLHQAKSPEQLCAYVILLKNQAWTAPTGSKFLCAP